MSYTVSIKALLPYHCRHTVIESESAMSITYSKVVQQLQQDLSKKNMLFSKDFVELSKVIGQGKYLIMVAAGYNIETEHFFVLNQDTA